MKMFHLVALLNSFAALFLIASATIGEARAQQCAGATFWVEHPAFGSWATWRPSNTPASYQEVCETFVAEKGVTIAKDWFKDNAHYTYSGHRADPPSEMCSFIYHATRTAVANGATAPVEGVSANVLYSRRNACPPPDPRKNFGEQCPKCGNPVNIATGNKLQVDSDYVGQGPMPLRFVRYYNSRLWRGQEPMSPTSSVYVSALGPNWRSTYDRFIKLTSSGSETAVDAYRPDGRTLQFKFANGQFAPDPDIADRVTQLFDSSGNATGWRYSVAQTDEIELYHNDGRLHSIKSRSGITHTLAYDAANRISSVADSFGRTLTITHNSSNQLETVTDPEGRAYIYSYNSVGNLSAVTYPDGVVRSYVYNESVHSGGNKPFALTGIIDESANRFATFKYDQYERAVSTEHAGGVEKYLLTYPFTDQDVAQTTVKDPRLQERVYEFENINGVAKNIAVNNPCGMGCAADTAYDSNGNVSSRTDFKGAKTCYAYDLARNLETVRLEGLASGLSCPANLDTYIPTSGTHQRKITTQWHPTYRIPTRIDDAGKRTSFTHDANGNVLTRTVSDLVAASPVSRTWTYTYNAYGKVLTADGPRADVSDITTYTYHNCTTGYECGQLHTVENAAGHTTTYQTYNAHGQPLTITDANGVLTTLTYDERQRLKSRTVGSEETTLNYWPTGLLKKVTLPDSSYIEYTYDDAHRLIDINDPDGNRIHYTLDAMGNRTREESYDPSNALAQERIREFDTLNRLYKEMGAAETGAVTTTYGYDHNGNRTNIAAPLGRATVQDYDELNRLTDVTDPLNGLTHYGYNALDQLISVTDPRGLVTSYEYNALGNLEAQTSPDTGVTANTYDSGGNLKTSTDARSVVTTYAYDELNRVATASFALGGTVDQTLTYSYDTGPHGVGRLTSVSDANHSLAWSYDEQGRVLTATQNVGSVSKTTGYSYLNGQRQSLTTPSGQVISYGYMNGKITSLSVNGIALVSNILYEPFGPARQWTWGNGELSVRTFDEDGKIAQIDSAGLKTYGYDDAFRITSITDPDNASLNQSYGYDLLDRLTSATGPSLNQGWDYDANGNRKTQTGSSASTFTTSSTSNRLSTVTGALTRTYSYDDTGNTTSDGTTTFVYNNAGRMISVTKSGTTTTYVYNALGQRVRKTQSGSSRYFVYDEAGRLLGEYDNAGALIQETVWFGDTPVATLRPNGSSVDVLYVHSDHLNTPRKITRPSDNLVVWRWDGDPFGTTAVSEDPDGDAVAINYGLRFPGQYFDAETGLHYNYFRDYDPATGKYVQSDPLGLKAGINTYAYVGGMPTMAFDPRGLASVTTWGEKWACMRTHGWSACMIANSCGDDATRYAERWFDGEPTGNSYDAQRHCALACCLARNLGHDVAKAILDEHERRNPPPPNAPCERTQDEFNNDIGLRLGQSGRPCTDCATEPLQEQCSPGRFEWCGGS